MPGPAREQRRVERLGQQDVEGPRHRLERREVVSLPSGQDRVRHEPDRDPESGADDPFEPTSHVSSIRAAPSSRPGQPESRGYPLVDADDPALVGGIHGRARLPRRARRSPDRRSRRLAAARPGQRGGRGRDLRPAARLLGDLPARRAPERRAHPDGDVRHRARAVRRCSGSSRSRSWCSAFAIDRRATA